MTACRLIELTGGPAERGEHYGRAAQAEILRGVEGYLVRMRDTGFPLHELDSLAELFLPKIEAFDPEQLEEMRGIARGAEVPLSHILLLNARTEILKLAGNAALRAELEHERGADGCTTIVVQPERSADGTLIHAHNWDWKASCADTCVVLRITGTDAPDMLVFTEAGALARFGFNAAGIAITGNYLECERDYRRAGVPLALLRRKVLRQWNYSEAIGTVYTMPKSASNNLCLSHAPSGVVHDLECAPDETFVIEPSDGLLVHSNHWLSPVALTRLRDTGVSSSPCSFWREQRARRLLMNARRIDDHLLETVLRDEMGSPLSICVPPRRSAITGMSATVASLIMRPEQGEMRLAMMPSAGGQFRTYRLEREIAPAQPEPANA
jgi:isopenicillin-N N-acyltransferase-like protein